MLHCDTYGDEKKPTILLLHGAGVVDTFRGQYSLAEHYHLVVPHLYGAGEAADRVYDPEALTGELLKLVDSLGKEQIGLMGHSLGAQLAVMLVCRRPERFSLAVFLSAWVDPRPGMVKAYCAMAGTAARMLHIRSLVRLQGKYWHFSREQTAYLVDYSQKITPDVYRSFFANTLDLRRLPAYAAVRIPMLAVFLAIIIAICSFVLSKTVYGRRVYACGGNLLAARVSGINTTRIRISTFAIAGLLAGLCGFLMTSRVTIGQPTAAESYEMDAITACVVGGVSMSGGVGKPWGVVAGCLLITVIANGLDIMGVSSHWQKIVKGVIIVLAVLIDIKGKSKKS